MESIYTMLLDTVEKLCLNETEHSNDIQSILSNVFDTLRLAGSIQIMAINIALIDLISKLLLSDDIKGILLFCIVFCIYYTKLFNIE